MHLPDPTEPFLLLDDARATGAAPARFYRDPVEIVVARTLDDVQPALDRIGEAREDGLHAAGYLSYEAGHALEPRLSGLSRACGPQDMPLLWFGLFSDYHPVAADAVAAMLPDPAGVQVGPLRPRVSREDYGVAFRTVQALIAAGDIYQANLTFPCDLPLRGDPRAIYAALRGQARAGYGGIVHTGEDWLLSFSPELFFTLVRGQLTARPMKGTAVRRADPAQDAAAIAALVADPKQRAENLMIVDLLRNDLSRVARVGSVTVPELFRVESYPTVHQMISTVRARILPGLSAIDVLRAIFPCGSITGAPKIRAMEVVDMVESAPRGPYTGAIGRIDPDGNAAFNVAIRTICAKGGSDVGRIGLGSGVVADSDEETEWRECLDKGLFLAGTALEQA
ncbi:aminodeoxychorismate synthase component I [Sphingobium aquiterrae]|uniref:aminodeoxychorismate synthase component I n=1 Tax=Sphingobium aquiterrae TaxID=2038656 RepID=UPI003019A1AB